MTIFKDDRVENWNIMNNHTNVKDEKIKVTNWENGKMENDKYDIHDIDPQ